MLCWEKGSPSDYGKGKRKIQKLEENSNASSGTKWRTGWKRRKIRGKNTQNGINLQNESNESWANEEKTWKIPLRQLEKYGKISIVNETRRGRRTTAEQCSCDPNAVNPRYVWRI